jgi:hypothetical protein
MVGSDPTLVAIVVPIVALVTLAFWLSLCFWAGSHPYWRHQQQANRQQLASPPPDRPGLPGDAARGDVTSGEAARGEAGGTAGTQRVAHG